jgi:N-glycosylase/DNA lyase
MKKGEKWEGVLFNDIITLEQKDSYVICEGTSDKKMILEYLRHGDDLDAIYKSISHDPFVRMLAERCPGLRILKQDPWECIATYVIATNANVKRIASMVESVCRTFGKDLGGHFSFPSAGDIADNKHLIGGCRLGYRENRFIELAEKVVNGDIKINDLDSMNYHDCSDSLKKINGIGDKVADCVSLFAFGHLSAFPADARIIRVLRERYGVAGNYKVISAFARERFGRYAGYAQELLYHSDTILGSHAHAGGSQPI